MRQLPVLLAASVSNNCSQKDNPTYLLLDAPAPSIVGSASNNWSQKDNPTYLLLDAPASSVALLDAPAPSIVGSECQQQL
jgi:hypothetical protein